MTHEEYQKAAEYWKTKDKTGAAVEKDRLRARMEEYINANNTCALATGAGDFVRCTPIEYAWHDQAFWMFTEGGEKFLALEKNKNVCLAIYDKYSGFGTVKGMQVSGTAEIIEPFSAEYIAAAAFKKIPVEALKKLPEPMYLLKIKPVRIDYLDSELKKQGFSSRQQLVF
jgi:general stress protein 26